MVTAAWTRIIAIAGVSAAVVTAVSPAALARPTGGSPRAQGLIAFTAETTTAPCCGDDLFTVRTDGTGERRLTHGRHITTFAWGPGGRRLVYANGHRVWIARADGSHTAQLFPDTYPRVDGLVWSPDGSRLAVITRRLLIFDFATHAITAVDHPIDAGYDGAAWSPDGSELVFSAADGNRRFQLWRDDVATGDVQQLTSYRRGEQGSGAVYPAWSPDGSRILFVLRVYHDFQETELTDLGSVAPDGSHLARITFSRRHGEHAAAWAPHGYRFVDASSDAGDVSIPPTYTALVVRRPDGAAIRRIHAPGEIDPSWSPTGRWILAVRPSYGTQAGHTERRPGLWLVRPDGSGKHRIVASKTIDAAVWQPRS
jgi:Tol biopolymer transport system component